MSLDFPIVVTTYFREYPCWKEDLRQRGLMMAGSIRASPAECMIPYLRGLSIGVNTDSEKLGSRRQGLKKAASNPPRRTHTITTSVEHRKFFCGDMCCATKKPLLRRETNNSRGSEEYASMSLPAFAASNRLRTSSSRFPSDRLSVESDRSHWVIWEQPSSMRRPRPA